MFTVSREVTLAGVGEHPRTLPPPPAPRPPPCSLEQETQRKAQIRTVVDLLAGWRVWLEHGCREEW